MSISQLFDPIELDESELMVGCWLYSICMLQKLATSKAAS